MFLIVEAAVITSQCPLLPAEAACEYSPAVCMRVPRHSAWIPLQLDIASYARIDGTLDMAALEHALVASVDHGDQQHDRMRWPEPLLEYDSWLNRRLAIALRGWGDIVAFRQADPTSLATLREMEELADWACRILHKQSRKLAEQSHWCPALDEAGALVAQKMRSRAWDRRWRKAVADVAVRHRNLATISPWDVFPRGNKADLRYANLLPLTRFADSLSYQCDVGIEHWNVNDFKGFYDRVAAIVQSHAGVGLVAKQV